MRRLLCLVFLVCVLANPVSAIVYNDMFSDPYDISRVNENEYLIVERTDPSNLVIFDTDRQSTSTRIINMPTLDSSCILSNGKIALAFNNGDLYLFDSESIHGIVDWSSPDTNEYFTLLGQLGGTNHRDVIADADNNIYMNSGGNVYVFTYPDYSSSVYFSGGSPPICSLATHPDGIVIGSEDYYNGHAYIRLYNGTASQTIRSWDKSSGTLNPYGVASTSNGDIYYAEYYRYNSDAGGIYRFNKSDSWSLSTIAATPAATDNGCDNYGICISDAGIIYVPGIRDDVIKTYSTPDAQGGYVPFTYSAPGDGSGDTAGNFTVGDSHEWTNDEIISGLRQYVPNIFFLLLLFYFMYVIGGK